MYFKKILSIILTIVLTMGMGTVTFANAENLETMPEIKEDYIPIYTAEDLNNIRNNLSGKYIMMNDIDLSVYENWEPIGTRETPFTGVFDGNSFTVKNLKITKAEGENPSVGLFGTVKNSQIKNVTVVGIINAHYDNDIIAGLICGEAYYSAISNCITFGEIVASTNAGACVGGVIGFLSEFSEDISTKKECIIKQSRNNATVTVNAVCNYDPYGINYFSGGIVGFSSGIIAECSNYGEVSAYGKNGDYEYFYILAGGICGNSSGELRNCYNIGNITSAGEKYAIAGGISGHWYQFGDISSCYNTGQVKAEAINYSGEYNHSFKGGIIGMIEGWVTPDVSDGSDYGCKAGVYNCYYLNDVEDAFGDGAPVNQKNVKALTKDEMKKQESFIGFDFENVWKMGESGYPEFRSNPINSDTDNPTIPESPEINGIDKAEIIYVPLKNRIVFSFGSPNLPDGIIIKMTYSDGTTVTERIKITDDGCFAGDERITGGFRPSVVEFGIQTDTLLLKDGKIKLEYKYLVIPPIFTIIKGLISGMI